MSDEKTETDQTTVELPPEAAKALEAGERAKNLLGRAAKCFEVLELEGSAKRMWREAEHAVISSQRLAKRIVRSGGKAEREAKKAERIASKKEKKAARIAKLRAQLAELTNATEGGAGN